MKELKPKIQLKYDEYINTWVDLIYDSFSKIVEKFNLNETNQLSLLVFLNLMVESSMLEKARIKKTVIEKVNSNIKENIIHKMVDDNEMLFSDLNKIVTTKLNEFKSILEIFGSKMSGDELITSFSRLILNVKDNDDEQIELLPDLASELLSSKITYDKLARNTGMSMKIVGQPKFIVQKD